MEDISQDPFTSEEKRSLVVGQVVHGKNLSGHSGKLLEDWF